MTAPRFTAGQLHAWAGSQLAAAGLHEDACDTVADTLVDAVASLEGTVPVVATNLASTWS